MRKTSDAGLDLIKSFEGLKLTAYQDIVGVWTIGWGCTEGIHKGMVISLSEAEEMLENELSKFEEAVSKLVKVQINDNEYAALISFAYNLGAGALGGSTLLKKLNAGDKAGAAEEFLKWNHAGGKVISGLTRRREAEQALFLTPMDGMEASDNSDSPPPPPTDQEILDKLKKVE